MDGRKCSLQLKPAPPRRAWFRYQTRSDAQPNRRTIWFRRDVSDKMDFATWEFVLSNGSQARPGHGVERDQGQSRADGRHGHQHEPDRFQIAGSSDDIDVKKADITLKFAGQGPGESVPKDGASSTSKASQPRTRRIRS